jgi:hypothetical protein
LNNWDNEVNYDKNTKFNKQVKEAEKFNQSSTSESNIVSPSYTTHPQAVYTSRLLNYKNLPEPQNSKEINIQFYTKYSGNYFLKLRFILFIYLTVYLHANIRLFAS